MAFSNFLLFILFLSLFSFSEELSSSVYSSLFSFTNNFNSSIISLSIFVRVMICLVRLKYEALLKSPKIFNLTTLRLLIIIMVFFVTDNLIVFYIMFEISLVPTLAMILKWGYQPERLQAGYYFMLYTVCASLPLLYVIAWVNDKNITLSIVTQFPINLEVVRINSLLISFSLLVAFMVKVPSWGVHL